MHKMALTDQTDDQVVFSDLRIQRGFIRHIERNWVRKLDTFRERLGTLKRSTSCTGSVPGLQELEQGCKYQQLLQFQHLRECPEWGLRSFDVSVAHSRQCWMCRDLRATNPEPNKRTFLVFISQLTGYFRPQYSLRCHKWN